VCQQEVRFGKLWIQFECLSGCVDDFRSHFTRDAADKNRAEIGVRVCQADVSRGERRISLYRLVEITNTLLDVSFGDAFA
jgi:hypothetical protein